MAGIIPISDFPSPLPDGFAATCEAALTAAGFGSTFLIAPDGVHVSDVATVTNIINTYSGSATELSFNKTKKQAALDALFDANFDLAKFIRGGTITTITAANVGAFLATITNNYRSLRAQISAASTLAVLNAINLNSGWPSNP